MDNGTYYSMKEFFGPVRLRRHNHDMHDIDGALHKGIDYLEFRNFDLDPLSRTGISDDTINFLELMLLNSILSPLPDNLEERLVEAKSGIMKWPYKSQRNNYRGCMKKQCS